MKVPLVSSARKRRAEMTRLSSPSIVTTRYHDNAVLLTGDGLLRGVAADAGRRVHGVL